MRFCAHLGKGNASNKRGRETGEEAYHRAHGYIVEPASLRSTRSRARRGTEQKSLRGFREVESSFFVLRSPCASPPRLYTHLSRLILVRCSTAQSLSYKVARETTSACVHVFYPSFSRPFATRHFFPRRLFHDNFLPESDPLRDGEAASSTKKANRNPSCRRARSP